jgi:hypothetical protein
VEESARSADEGGVRRCSFTRRSAFDAHFMLRQNSEKTQKENQELCILTTTPVRLRTHFFLTPPAVHSSRSSRAVYPLHLVFSDASLLSALDVPRTLAAQSSSRLTSSPFNLPSASPSSSFQPRG